MVQILTGKMDSENLQTMIVKGATGTFTLNVGFQGLLFLTSIILARLLGSSGYGAYVYALSWIMLLSVPADLGLNRMLIRNVASYQTQLEWERLAGLLKWASRTALLTSLLIVTLAAAVSYLLKAHFNSQMLSTFWVALVLLPISIQIRIKHGSILGFNRISLAHVPEMLFQPLLFIILIVGGYLLAKAPMSAPVIMSLNVIAAGITFVFIAYLLRGILPPEVKDCTSIYETNAWLHSGFFIVLVGGMHVLNSRTDVLMLGTMVGAESVGIYNIASRGAELINFILMPVHQAIGPTVSSFYVKKDINGLQRLVTKSTRIVLMLSLPIALLLIIEGRWFLLLYGLEFTQGHMALSILSIGQISSIVLGPVALLLIMTGFERDAAIAVGIGAILNIILNSLFIPLWGLDGAALATAISKVLCSVVMVARVYKKLGIHSTILGGVGPRRSAN